jgi:hypothetical protein
MHAKQKLAELVGHTQAELILSTVRNAPAIVPELVDHDEHIHTVSFVLPGNDDFAEWDELERIIQCHHREAEKLGCKVYFKLDAVN